MWQDALDTARPDEKDGNGINPDFPERCDILAEEYRDVFEELKHSHIETRGKAGVADHSGTSSDWSAQARSNCADNMEWTSPYKDHTQTKHLIANMESSSARGLRGQEAQAATAASSGGGHQDVSHCIATLRLRKNETRLESLMSSILPDLHDDYRKFESDRNAMDDSLKKYVFTKSDFDDYFKFVEERLKLFDAMLGEFKAPHGVLPTLSASAYEASQTAVVDAVNVLSCMPCVGADILLSVPRLHQRILALKSLTAADALSTAETELVQQKNLYHAFTKSIQVRSTSCIAAIQERHARHKTLQTEQARKQKQEKAKKRRVDANEQAKLQREAKKSKVSIAGQVGSMTWSTIFDYEFDESLKMP